jgi:xylulokinase
MCVNGTGAMYRWMRQLLGGGEYSKLNALAETSPIGARGVSVIPYGNGAERTLNNRIPGASIQNLDLNLHTAADIVRATQEGIVFALVYGLEIIKEMGFTPTRVRAGAANMFQSPLFREAFACSTQLPVELYSTDGSEGAARGAGIGAKLFSSLDAFKGLNRLHIVEPMSSLSGAYRESYERWKIRVNQLMEG